MSWDTLVNTSVWIVEVQSFTREKRWYVSPPLSDHNVSLFSVVNSLVPVAKVVK